jgi:hypothetical protein
MTVKREMASRAVAEPKSVRRAKALTIRSSSNFLTQPFFLQVSTIRSEGVRWMVAWDRQSGASAVTVVGVWSCPHDCP